nr:oxygenase MpaB family protein [[Mycobacterium] stephanolepidis]
MCYWDRIVEDELVGDTRVARYTVGYITKGISRAFPPPAVVPTWLWNRLLAPALDRVAAFLGAGGLDPALRGKLDIPWSDRQEIRYRRFCAAVRAVGPAWERLAPLHLRYSEQAVAGFRREGIDPRKIAPTMTAPIG